MRPTNLVSPRFLAAALAAFALDAAPAFHPSEAAADRLRLWLAVAFAVMLADLALGEAERWRRRSGGMEGDWGGLPAVVWFVSIFLLFIAEAVAQDKPPHVFFPPRNIFLLGLETGLLLVLAAFSKGLADTPPRPRPKPLPRPVPVPEPRPEPGPRPTPLPPAPAPRPFPSSDWAERNAAIIAHCRAHGGRIATRECMDLLRISRARAKVLLTRLVQAGVLTHTGKIGDTDAHYILAKNP